MIRLVIMRGDREVDLQDLSVSEMVMAKHKAEQIIYDIVEEINDLESCEI